MEGENIAKTMNAGNKDLIQKNNTEVKHGRRMSERLKRDGGIRIEENNRRMAVKRNLESNPHVNVNNFSCLSPANIMLLSRKMGINMDDQHFDSTNLMKEMEMARNNLNQKRDHIKEKSNKERLNEITELSEGEKESWSHEDEDDQGEFTLVQSIQKKKEWGEESFLVLKYKKILTLKEKEEAMGKSQPIMVNKKIKIKMMKGLFWNCRGLKKKGMSVFIKNLINQYWLSFIGI